jgi:hypothetical protein
MARRGAAETKAEDEAGDVEAGSCRPVDLTLSGVPK